MRQRTLSEETIAAIRAEYSPRKMTYKMLSKKYGTSAANIFLIVNGYTYKN